MQTILNSIKFIQVYLSSMNEEVYIEITTIEKRIENIVEDNES